jgi:ethanolamine ammonia-lyase small subunit
MSNQSMSNTPASSGGQSSTASGLRETTPSLAARLQALTPARVGLRRAGISVATREVLEFQLAHARARDAVHAPLQPASLLAALRHLSPPEPAAASAPLLLHSKAADRQNYLQRPDLGRTLNEASLQRLRASTPSPGETYDLAIVLADGLSALAVEHHAVPLLAALFLRLVEASPALRVAPLCIVEQGRVAIGDEIAQALPAALVIVLIGERPGLSSPDSLGAYITWKPQPGRTTDAERNCISNIRAEGLSYNQAAARLLHYICEARIKHGTGTTLKDPTLKDPEIAPPVPRLEKGPLP